MSRAPGKLSIESVGTLLRRGRVVRRPSRDTLCGRGPRLLGDRLAPGMRCDHFVLPVGAWSGRRPNGPDWEYATGGTHAAPRLTKRRGDYGLIWSDNLRRSGP